ncbi:MAG TPA: YkgJ family cysteine cluster protein [Thioalkalivibrio sp.]|nr:YkgJ family cysteine cluster protein [Thioalkalivibrio sp.]
MTAINPCVECGACCATFRVSFYWAEADDAPGGTVPAALTGRLHAHLRVMQGTDRPEPRCCALQGEIGGNVSCAIYPRRSSTCRDFKVAWEGGEPNEACNRARARHGLPPAGTSDRAHPGLHSRGLRRPAARAPAP